MFGFSEYIVVISNIAFHLSTVYDLQITYVYFTSKGIATEWLTNKTDIFLYKKVLKHTNKDLRVGDLSLKFNAKMLLILLCPAFYDWCLYFLPMILI